MTQFQGIDEDWSKVGTLPAWCRFVIGYVSQDTTGKNITRAQVDAAHAQGADVGLVFEYDPNSAAGGAAAGTRDAGIAIQVAKALGAPAGVALYAAVDFNATGGQLATVLAYANAFQAACAAAGYRSGVYADYAVCAYLAQHGYTGFLWQTYAWSGTPPTWWAGDAIHQVQNGIQVAGATVDEDITLVDDWGQWEAELMDAAQETELLRNAHNSDWAGTAILGGSDPAIGFRQTDGSSFQTPNVLHQRLEAIQAAVTAGVPVTLPDPQLAALAAGVAAQLGGKLDAVLAAIAALGTREAVAAQAEADAFKA